MLFKIIIYFTVNIGSLFLLKNYLTNFDVSSLESAAIFVVALTAINWIIVPIVKLLAFPINFLTLGLFNVVISAIAVWFVVRYVDGVQITGDLKQQAITLIILSITFSLAGSFSHKLTKDRKDD